MSVDMDIATRRALDRLAVEEAARMRAAEEAERLRREQRAAEADTAFHAAEARVVERLAELADGYERRARLAREAADLLAEFYALDRQLAAGVEAALAEVGGAYRGMRDEKVAQRLADLRRAAGLAERHTTLSLAAPRSDAEACATTAIKAISAGLVGPGLVAVGRETARLDLSGGA